MATQSFLCTDCGVTFTAKRNLTRHIGLVHTKTQVTCEKCGKHFTRKDNLKRHLVRCSPKNSGTLTCEKCQKKFSSKSNLNKHMKTHATPMLWMMDGQKVDYMKHESLEKDMENYIEQQMKKQLKLWNHLENFSQNIFTET